MFILLSWLLGVIFENGGDSFCYISTWLSYVNYLSLLIFGHLLCSEADNCLFCHETILSAFCLIDDRDCENFMASETDSCLFVMK